MTRRPLRPIVQWTIVAAAIALGVSMAGLAAGFRGAAFFALVLAVAAGLAVLQQLVNRERSR